MVRHPLDGIQAADGDAGLRTAEEFVSGEQHYVRALFERLPDTRLVAEPSWWTVGDPGGVGIQQAATDVGDEWSIQRGGNGSHLRERHLLGEALDAVVRRMDLEDGPDRCGQRGEIARPRPVGRADLDELHPRRGHQVREAERSADLDEFSSRHRDTALAAGKCGECEEEGSGVVVHDEGCFRAGRGCNELVQVRRSFPPCTGIEIELEVASTGQVGTNGRRPAKVRVEEHPGGVDHAAKPGRSQHAKAIGGDQRGIGRGI